MARRSPSSRWMTRLSGRAPKAGSKPSRGQGGARPSSVTSSAMRRVGRAARAAPSSWISTMRPRSSSVSAPEPHDVVDAVDELGLEEVAGVARQVRRHDQHGVGEVDRAALAVGEAAVVEHLQQDVEHVGVGLLDLVEQHHRVGPAAHRLGELAALVVADVAGRRADEAATPCASPCTRSCRCGPSPARRRRGSRPACGPARSCRRRWGRGTGTSRWAGRGSDRPARLRRMALATAVTASSWPTTRSWRTLLHADELLASRPPSGGRPARRSTWTTTSAMSSSSTSSFSICWLAWSSARLLGGLVDLPLELGDLAVADLGRLLEVGLALELGCAWPRAAP